MPSDARTGNSPCPGGAARHADLTANWDIEPTLEPALASGSVDAILRALEQHARGATVVLVGHEPTVSALLGELLGVISSEAIVFEPGAAALLEISSVARHSGRLVWFLPPDLSQ